MTDPPASVVPTDPTLFDLPGAADPAIDDQAAELDDTTPADAPGADVYDLAEAPTFTGVCEGGPYDGRSVSIRFPGGFLLYDKQGRRLWTYAADASHPVAYLIAGGGPATADTNADSLRSAAEGIQYDVLAYDDAGPAE